MATRKKSKPKATQPGGFLRVRSATGAAHLYDIPVHVYERHPERYVAVDPERVEQARPAEMVAGASAPENNDAREGDSEEEKL